MLASPFLLVKLFEKRELRGIRSWTNFGSIAQDHRPIALFVVKGGPLRQTLSVWIAVRREVNPIRREHVRNLMIEVRPRAGRQ